MQNGQNDSFSMSCIICVVFILFANAITQEILLFFFVVDVLGATEETFESDGFMTKIIDLEADTKYHLYLSAVTIDGARMEYYIEDKTLLSSSN